MASPGQSQATGPSTQPLTPPAEPSTSTSQQQTSSQPTTAPQQSQTTTTTSAAPSAQQQQPQIAQPTQIPSTSTKDSGKSRRPRDVRLIHMLLSSLGVTSYQERVPLQLLDFAYRYTSSVLQDAVHLATEGYAGATDGTSAGGGGRGGGGGSGGAEVNSVSLPALRLSIASRLHYQFQTGLPKEFLMDVAGERNRVALPGAQRGFDQGLAQGQQKPQANQSVLMAGMRLPPERFCLTGTGWDLKDEWDSEGEEEVEGEGEGVGGEGGGGEKKKEEEEEEGEGDAGEDEEDDGKMEDIFGEDTTMRDGDDDGDKDMTDV